MGNNLDRLNELITIELDNCNDIDWPYVCQMASNPETRKQVEGMIMQQIDASGISVGDAIERIERAYNPNKMDD